MTNQASARAFLAGGGELGELTRQKDWSQTPLGSPDQWPQSLRTILSLLLHARNPMFAGKHERQMSCGDTRHIERSSSSSTAFPRWPRTTAKT